jgi:4-methylaminobutanoate oxidase (formaldehyde-forming)
MDVEPGKVVYTQWLNERGGIEADLTVTRLVEDRFWIVTAPATRVRDRVHLERGIGSAQATLTDVSDDWTTLGVMGPASRALLTGLANVDLGPEAFPFGTSQDFEIARVSVRGLRTTYVGELGWELYVPVGSALEVHDRIFEAGAEVGLRHCGFRSMLSCRIEKGYRHWGHDIGPDDNPLQAGLRFAVAWEKATDFVGRAALEDARARPLSRRLLHFAIDDPEAMPHHDEPIWRDGRRMGLLTSGAWGHAVNAAVGLGWAENVEGAIDAVWVREGNWEIEIAGRLFTARASLRPFYDPGSKRVRS